MSNWFALDTSPSGWARPWVQTLVAGILAGPLAVGLLWWRQPGRMSIQRWVVWALPLVLSVGIGILLPRPYADHAVVWLMLACAATWAFAIRRLPAAVPAWGLGRLLWFCLWVSVLNAVVLMGFSYTLYHYNLAQLQP